MQNFTAQLLARKQGQKCLEFVIHVELTADYRGSYKYIKADVNKILLEKGHLVGNDDW